MVYMYLIIDSWSVLSLILTNNILTTWGEKRREKKKKKLKGKKFTYKYYDLKSSKHFGWVL